MALRDQPYLPLYIQDFLTDEKLIECSAQSTGVYVRLMCIMHKSEDYGKILLKQKDKQKGKQTENFALKLAKQMPYSEQVVFDSIVELLNEDVLYIEGDYLCQKRMIHDNELSQTRAKAGKKGGDFAQAKVKAKQEAKTEYENEVIVFNSKESIQKSIFSDQQFIEGLTVTHKGKDIRQAFDECYIHHSNSQNPPKELWEWRQKLNSWLTIKPQEKKTKDGVDHILL